jgi:hypothetical protein
VAFLLQAFGVLEHWAANVVADVGELVRFADLHGDVILKMNDPDGGTLPYCESCGARTHKYV